MHYTILRFTYLLTFLLPAHDVGTCLMNKRSIPWFVQLPQQMYTEFSRSWSWYYCCYGICGLL